MDAKYLETLPLPAGRQWQIQASKMNVFRLLYLRIGEDIQYRLALVFNTMGNDVDTCNCL